MADEKFRKKVDYDGDGKTGTKSDRRTFKDNVEEYGTGQPTKDTISKDDLADIAGIPDEWIKENSEIKRLFSMAIEQGWNKSTTGQQKFINEFLNSTTYKKHGASMAAYLVAKDKGGQDFQNLLDTEAEKVRNLAVQLGANVDDEMLAKFADRSLAFGWDEGDLRKVLTGQYSFTDGAGTVHTYDTDLLGYDKGWAQNQMVQLKNTAARNGVSFNDEWYNSAVRSVAAGLGTAEDYAAQIRKQAASRFPVWRGQIEAGFDVEDLASPYTSIMQKRLGRGRVELDDPLLKQAFNRVDDKGQPAVMGLWDFEKAIKRTDEWAESEDGHNEVMSLTRQLGRMMGFTG